MLQLFANQIQESELPAKGIDPGTQRCGEFALYLMGGCGMGSTRLRATNRGREKRDEVSTTTFVHTKQRFPIALCIIVFATHFLYKTMLWWVSTKFRQYALLQKFEQYKLSI